MLNLVAYNFLHTAVSYAGGFVNKMSHLLKIEKLFIYIYIYISKVCSVSKAEKA